MCVPDELIKQAAQDKALLDKLAARQRARITDEDYGTCEVILSRIEKKLVQSDVEPAIVASMLCQAREYTLLGARTALRVLEREYVALCSRRAFAKDCGM